MSKEKKKYTKPALKKNDQLVNITFASVGSAGSFTAGSAGTGAAVPT